MILMLDYSTAVIRSYDMPICVYIEVYVDIYELELRVLFDCRDLLDCDEDMKFRTNYHFSPNIACSTQ